MTVQTDPAGDPATQLHTDLSLRVVVDTHRLAWLPSPQPGVERRMLERDGGEVARATTIVRFAPGASFAGHEHGGGEEIYVLEGGFSDEHGNYPAGSYLRNPPGSRHAPTSAGGCLLLVKLRQLPAGERERLVVGADENPWRPGRVEGVEIRPLFGAPGGGEWVYLVRFQPGATLGRDEHEGGEELFVLSGVQEDEFGRYPAGTWLRQPAGSAHHPRSPEGSTLWVKRGHLPG